jgi:hypothetical protein
MDVASIGDMTGVVFPLEYYWAQQRKESWRNNSQPTENNNSQRKMMQTLQIIFLTR